MTLIGSISITMKFTTMSLSMARSIAPMSKYSKAQWNFNTVPST